MFRAEPHRGSEIHPPAPVLQKVLDTSAGPTNCYGTGGCAACPTMNDVPFEPSVNNPISHPGTDIIEGGRKRGAAGTDGAMRSGRAQAFPPTRWTRVRQYASADPDGDAKRALERLCRDYWFPLYAYARRRGSREEDAQDLVQGFFVHVIRTRLFGKADPEAGRLRSFLLKSFVNYSASEHTRSRAMRRGGTAEWVTVDWELAERSLAQLADTAATPEELYDRNWGMEMLQRTLYWLEKEYAETGRAALFEALRPFLSLDPPGPAATAAAGARLGLSAEAMRQSVHRVRTRFGKSLRGLISDTLDSPTEAEVDFEMETLRRAVAGK